MSSGTKLKETIVETLDGEEIHRGTVRSASKFLGINEASVRRGIYVCGGFVGGVIVKYVQKDETLQYLVKHLTEYGSTVLGEIKENKVRRYQEELEELGIYTTYRKVKYKEDRRAWYVLERVNNVQSEATLYGLPGNR